MFLILISFRRIKAIKSTIRKIVENSLKQIVAAKKPNRLSVEKILKKNCFTLLIS
jgi:hypothetical protein